MRPGDTKPFTLRRDIPASVLPLESFGPGEDPGAVPSEGFKFPLLTAPPVTSWQPTLAGEGDFPPQDPVAMAQDALARLDAGMLRLHTDAGFAPEDPSPRGRAA
jgi:hypothetical protein